MKALKDLIFFLFKALQNSEHENIKATYCGTNFEFINQHLKGFN